MLNFDILMQRKFLPLFITQTCGCLNDSLIKSAFIIYVTYKLSSVFGLSSALFVLLIQAVFIIPFVIFASIAGIIADKYSKTTIIFYVKLCEIFIVLMSIYGFLHSNIFILLLVIFLLGTHSTFFGPIKYSILPEQLEQKDLLNANGLIEAGTFIAICIGSIMGGLYNYYQETIIITSIILAFIGFAASLMIPRIENENNLNKDIKISFNIIKGNKDLITYCLDKREILISILGNSWFWFIGSCFMSQIPLFAKITLSGDETVTNLFLIIFSIGVGIGSSICNSLYKGEINTKYVYISAVGMTLFGIDLYYATNNIVSHENLINIKDFIGDIYNWRILFDMFCFSAIGGIFVVPFYAMLQYFSPPAHRSRVIAANNIINSIFMVLSALFLAVLFALDISIPNIILLTSLINFSVAIIIYKIAPDSLKISTEVFKMIFRFILNKIYKVEVKGLDNFYAAGNKVLIIANHVSFIDSILLGLYLPENQMIFAINSVTAQNKWIKFGLRFVKTYSLDARNPLAIKNLIEELKKNQKVVIFPEGRITNTGSLMKVYEGPSTIAEKADCVILPIHINGPQYTYFARNKNAKSAFFPKITINILPHITYLAEKIDLSPKARRKAMTLKLYDVMCNMSVKSSNTDQNLYFGLLETAKFYKYKEILDDITYTPVNYRGLIARTIIIANVLIKKIKQDNQLNNLTTSNNSNNITNVELSSDKINETIQIKQKIFGLMLPTSVGCVSVFFGMQLSGVLPAMINFSLGSRVILNSCKVANIDTIYTSRKFIEQGNLGHLITEMQDKIIIIFLEDLKIGLIEKIKGFCLSFFAKEYFEYLTPKINANYQANKDNEYIAIDNFNSRDPNNPAVILFTSGTEGDPKAVALSHKNIFSNMSQFFTQLDLHEKDICFNCLPMFHSFGIMVSLAMVLRGIKCILYPSPLHYNIIPEFFYESSATIFLSTDTFLNMYYKSAHPYDFFAAKYIIAGAEKVRDSTRQLWLEKFGIRILEGYGATECSPAISMNNKMYSKPGSVGRILAGIQYKLEEVENINTGKKLIVKGDNIMLGYIKDGKIQKLEGGWYDTGDIVEIDESGYMTIIARLKRFAKIGGEMVSLPKVEEIASQVQLHDSHAAICIKNEAGLEKVILVTTSKDLQISEITSYLEKNGISMLFAPKEIITIQEMILLPNGKINYKGLEQYYYDNIKNANINPLKNTDIPTN